jgi:hypothetical protein
VPATETIRRSALARPGRTRDRRAGIDMDDADFEGTLVLEQLAAIDKVDEFFEAIDADDVDRATRLMKRANLDAATIAIVVRKIEESDSNH